MHRFFIFNEQKNPYEFINPNKEILHQVKKVLRIKQNERFVCIYKNLEIIATLNNNSFKVIETKEFEIKKSNRLILIQGIPTNKKVSLILQKATELDVDEIILWNAGRSTAKLNEFSNKKERFEKIIIEACEQSRRNDIPSLSFISSLDKYNFSNKNIITLYENEEDNHIRDLIDNSNEDIVLIIGPEGGIEPFEIEYLISKGSKIATLGKNILRTETAAIASLSIVGSIIRK